MIKSTIHKDGWINNVGVGEDKNGGDGNAGDEYGSTTPPAGVGQESEESAAFQGLGEIP